MSRAAVFLDRDGVINERRRMLVRRWSQFRFLPGVHDALANLASSPYAVVVATNQEWVDWGWITASDHADVHERMCESVAAGGGRVDAVYACTHRHSKHCACRKPKPGMLLDAARDLDLDLAKSWFVGDNKKDMVAGKTAGVRTILVDPRWRTRWQGAEAFADVVVRDRGVAVVVILERGAP